MNRKTWLNLQIVFGFVFIYIASYVSLFSLILSFENIYKYKYFQIPNPCLYFNGLLLFILVVFIFQDTCNAIEELTILKIKECEEK